MDNVIVYNIPLDFPDSELHSLVQQFKDSSISKSDLTTILNAVRDLPQGSSISNVDGSIQVSVTNLSESLANLGLSDICGEIKDSVDTHAEICRNVREEVYHVEEALNVSNEHTEAISDCVSDLRDIGTNLSGVTSEINNGVEQLKQETSQSNTSLGDIVSKLQSVTDSLENMVTPADLPIEDGAVVSRVENIPSTFPDPATLNKLKDLELKLNYINADMMCRDMPLPCGANHLGSVAIDRSVLPHGAASDSLQKSIIAELHGIASRLNTDFDEVLSTIVTRVSEIRNALSLPSAGILYKSGVVSASGKPFRTPIIENSNMRPLRLHFASQDNSAFFSITVLTSMDGNSWYPVHGAANIKTVPGEYHTVEISSSFEYLCIDVKCISKQEGSFELYLQKVG